MIKERLLKNLLDQNDKIKMHIDEPDFIIKNVDFLNHKLSKAISLNRPIITICIGTDRSTGDSLGPLVGWHLQQKLPINSFIYGTIDNPVHATNIKEIIAKINNYFNNPFLIAVDACLGKIENIGYVNIKEGSIRPGAAVNKNLPPVGEISISGIVNVGGFMEYFVLQNTRLSLVMKMADKISDVLSSVYQKII